MKELLDKNNKFVENISTNLPYILSIGIHICFLFALILCFNVSSKIIVGWGILSWAIGAGFVKITFYHFITVGYIHKNFSNFTTSVFNGLFSDVSELGAALAFMYFVLSDKLSLYELIGFGFGAGLAEAIILPLMGNPFKNTPLQEKSDNINEIILENKALIWYHFIERIMASIIHVSTRGLVYFSKISGNVLPAFIAFSFFSYVDGKTYYNFVEKSDFASLNALKAFYFWLGCLCVLLFVFFISFLNAIYS